MGAPSGRLRLSVICIVPSPSRATAAPVKTATTPGAARAAAVSTERRRACACTERMRSVHAHARLRSVDTAAARAAPGVVAVFTGAAVARDGLGTMQMTLKRKRPDGAPMWAPPHRGLCQDRARYVGDPVAMVVAETP